jgi:UDP-MurNAc hydroxylase
MKMTFIANACAIYESKGKKLLADPWLVDGAFYGSWFHYPPLKTKPEDVADYDYLYISHLHPDHYCRETIKAFDKSKPVIIYDDQGSNFLEKIMLKDGFTNITKLKDKEAAEFGPFVITMFGPFTKHPFHDCQIGNIIDSAMLIEDDETTILNANDNTLSLDAARMFTESYPRIDIAQLNYNPAGPYPACFYSLAPMERKKAAKKVLNRQLEHMYKVAEILMPTYVQPFAGAYVIGGKRYRYNEFLGTTTQEEAGTYLNANNSRSQPLLLNEGQSLGDKFVPIRPKQMADYIDSLRKKPYSYHGKEAKYNDDEMLVLMQTARKRMYRKQVELGYKDEHWFFIKLLNDKKMYRMNLKNDDVTIEDKLLDYEEFTLCHIERTLMEDILDRKAHWNNAEIGCHIDFYRMPDLYRPDFHTFMSFFHC